MKFYDRGKRNVALRCIIRNNPAYTNEDLLAMYMITGGVAKLKDW